MVGGNAGVNRGRRGSGRRIALLVVGIAGLLIAIGRGPLWTTGATERTRDDPAPASTQRAAPRPDVIVIAIDGLGPGDIGAFGGIAAPTPVLDEIARTSVVYSDAYAPSPWAAESLLAALTGCYRPAVLAEDRTPSLAEELDHLGYRSALIPAHERHRISQATFAGAGKGAKLESIGFGDVLLPDGFEDVAGARAEDVTALGVEWLGRSKQPSLLVAVFGDPRPPHHRHAGLVAAADAPYEGPVRAGMDHEDLLRLAPEFGPVDRARLVALHASEVAAADRAVGHLIEAARKRRGMSPVIVVVGLRAPALGRNGRYGLLPSLAPEDLRVPFMVQFPVARGTDSATPLQGEIDTPVSLVDLTPTLIDALGLDPRLDIDGRTIFPGASTPSRPLCASTTRGIRAAVLLLGDRALVLRCEPPLARVHARAASFSTSARLPAAMWESAAEITARDSDLRDDLGDWMTRAGVVTSEEAAELSTAPFPE